MSFELIGISVLWLFLFGYIIVASIDFGAGFFNAYSVLTNKQHIISNIIQRYLSPVWEVTNVFLVFFFVGMVGFFPGTAYFYGTILLVPASISIVLLAIRGAYYAFTTYGRLKSKFWTYLYGFSGLFIPASLSIVLTISEGGFIYIEDTRIILNYFALFASPLTWSIVILSLTSVLYISAVFLTWYANKAEDKNAAELMRKYALSWALPAIITALGIIVELRLHNPIHYNRLLDVWWLFVISFALFLITLRLIWVRKKYGVAFTVLVFQFLVAFFAYGVSHYPYLLYPHLTVTEGFTSEAMAIALIIAFIAGLCLLIPSLYLILKLFLFNKEYVQGKAK
ncbi:cytochrome d ubiquinol oxidase subunit II [Gracilibacillus ureilyticus]|uniref:Cytochrome d ubiquinol oxidase subunit II n=1 Tax=Gracilibacillus ureilyticus TaxID=531814 RepID=A0A1H9TD85_9BACI|nr:cytochrome d ubiquinol oxidase subunit II [Gracilibacillus ureilyticus]SER94769.1 cytochrome d ubiquinol oxidase subunit II [Gracilibacillus ureilyticus]